MLLISLCMLLVAVIAESMSNTPTNMIMLTDSNFDQFTKHGTWILDFYAPWCTHCKQLHPVFEEVASFYSSADSEVYFGLIDCTEQSGLKGRFSIRGFPTIMFYRNGNSKLYRHARTVEGFKSFISEMTRPAVDSVVNLQQLNTMLYNDQGAHQAVFLYLGAAGPEQQAFQSAAEEHQGLVRAVTPSGHLTAAAAALPAPRTRENTARIAEALSLAPESLPALLSLSPGRAPIRCPSPLTSETVSAFMAEHRLPLLATLTPANFDAVMHTARPAVLVVTAADPAEHGAAAAEARTYLEKFLPLAAAEADHFSFATLPAPSFAQYLSQFGVGAATVPTLLAIEYDRDLYYVDEPSLEQGRPMRHADQQRAFLVDLREGRLRARATTAWYSPQRYVRMLEKWMHRMGEETAVIIISVAMLATVVVVGWLLYRITTDETGEEAVRKLEQQLEQQQKRQEQARQGMRRRGTQ